MSDTAFTVRYEGEADCHDLDAALLSQALLGFSDIGRIAYRHAHPEETHTLNVNVKALQAGSFEIVLDVVVPPLEQLYDQLVGLFTRSDVEATLNAAGLAGLVGAAYKLIVWRAGRTVEARFKGHEVHVTASDGETTTVPVVVYNIGRDAHFIDAAHRTLAPLEDSAYTRMEICGSRGATLSAVDKEERGYFKLHPDTRLRDETLDLDVSIITVQIDAPGKAWTFKSGDQKFNARVVDEEFLQRIATQGFPFNTRTRALVTRRETEKLQADGRVKAEYLITKVHRLENDDADPTLF